MWDRDLGWTEAGAIPGFELVYRGASLAYADYRLYRLR